MEQITLKVELLINDKIRKLDLVLTDASQIEEFRTKVNMGGLMRMGSVMFKGENVVYVEVIKE